MLADGKKASIAGDDVACSSFEGSREELVIIGIVAHGGELRVRNDIGQHYDIFEPELGIGSAEKLAHLSVGERAQHLVHD